LHRAHPPNSSILLASLALRSRFARRYGREEEIKSGAFLVAVLPPSAAMGRKAKIVPEAPYDHERAGGSVLVLETREDIERRRVEGNMLKAESVERDRLRMECVERVKRAALVGRIRRESESRSKSKSKSEEEEPVKVVQSSSYAVGGGGGVHGCCAQESPREIPPLKLPSMDSSTFHSGTFATESGSLATFDSYESNEPDEYGWACRAIRSYSSSSDEGGGGRRGRRVRRVATSKGEKKVVKGERETASGCAVM
jgi:hypothetical protein